MRKEYPKRPSFSSDHICECGHNDFDHEVSFFRDLPNLWKNDYPCGHGNCQKCLCPKFKLDKPDYITSKPSTENKV